MAITDGNLIADVSLMIGARTLADLLANSLERCRCTTYLEGDGASDTVSGTALNERALRILHRLRKLGAAQGSHLILFTRNNAKFVEAFWAAVLGGIVPVPVAVDGSEQHKRKLLRIAAKLTVPFIYADRAALERIGAYAAEVGGTSVYEALRRRVLFADEDDSENGACAQPVMACPEDVALIQFSSGSTSEPKGVMLSHANLLANIRGVSERASFSERDVSLSWMPLTHDFGLIGFYLTMFAHGMHVYLMPTDLFVRRPCLWLEYASSVRASLLGSPNFGYKHVLKALGERPVDDLDLSSVRLIYNGAEPISPRLCEQFMARLQDAKLRRNAMYPAYGLAEACVAVSLPEPDAPLCVLNLDRCRMNVGMQIQPIQACTADVVTLISEGSVVPYCDLRIAADDDGPLLDGRVGHIQIRGANVTKAYYQDASATAAAFTADGWLRTGDLGVIWNGQLYVTGRTKELVLIRGQNFYPHDLEQIVQTAAGFELGRVAAVSVPGEDSAQEQLVIFVMHRGGIPEFAPIAAEIVHAISQQANLEVGAVVPVKRIPKTTSGKLQRLALRERYLSGEFKAELQELAELLRVRPAPEIERRTAIEERLRRICALVLEGRDVGVLENLFEIGASSLTLVAIHEHIDQEFPGQLDLAELFDFPTIAAMAQRLHGGSLEY
jgi:acyl-CoA synthetase (AMP-forming)/AMP-acid ligase II